MGFFRIGIYRIMRDLQDLDDALHRWVDLTWMGMDGVPHPVDTAFKPV